MAEIDVKESILNSVKKMIGPSIEYTVFDADLIMHINSVFNILRQLGVGPPEGFSISDETSVWTDFLPDGSKLNMVKTYMYAKVRLIFDPPQNSTIAKAFKDVVDEFEFRTRMDAEIPCFINNE